MTCSPVETSIPKKLWFSRRIFEGVFPLGIYRLGPEFLLETPSYSHLKRLIQMITFAFL